MIYPLTKKSLTCIDQNLRLNPPLDLLLPRKTAEDTFLAGTFIPKDTVVSVDVGALHSDPRNWKNPDEFVPERFDDDGEQKDHEGLTWVPFSNGTRQCIGMNFSLMEQKLVLTMLCKSVLSFSLSCIIRKANTYLFIYSEKV